MQLRLSDVCAFDELLSGKRVRRERAFSGEYLSRLDSDRCLAVLVGFGCWKGLGGWCLLL